jgi:hypothetical protein
MLSINYFPLSEKHFLLVEIFFHPKATCWKKILWAVNFAMARGYFPWGGD